MHYSETALNEADGAAEGETDGAAEGETDGPAEGAVGTDIGEMIG